MNTQTTVTARSGWRDRVAAAGVRGLSLAGPDETTTVELAQPMCALRLANQLRMERAQLKRELQAGAVSFSEAARHRAAEKASVAELLRALPRFGRVRAERYAHDCALSPTRLCGRLTPHQLLRIELRLAAARARSTPGHQRRRRARSARVRAAKAAVIADELGLAA